MPKELQGLIFSKIELEDQQQTFKVRREIKRIDNKIKKIAKRFAKEQANKVYQQTYDFIYNIVNANCKSVPAPYLDHLKKNKTT